jgi:hypothetical protein
MPAQIVQDLRYGWARCAGRLGGFPHVHLDA